MSATQPFSVPMRRRRLAGVLGVLGVLGALGAPACGPPRAALQPSAPVVQPRRADGPDGRLFAALADTLRLARRDLGRPGGARPFFLAAAAAETAQHVVRYSLGQVVLRSRVRQQWVYGMVRMGSYGLDCSTELGLNSAAARLPFPPETQAVRRALLPALRGAHRWAVLRLKAKQRWLQTHPPPDRLPDWTAASSVSHMARAPRFCRPPDDLRVRLRRASAVFRRFPDIHDTAVTLNAATWAVHTVTSEAARLYRDGATLGVSLQTRTLAPDGERLDLDWHCHTPNPQRLPTATALEHRARVMARQLTRLRAAPRLQQRYDGPVLFEGQAATAALLHVVGRLLAANRTSLYAGQRVSAEGWMGRRILPAWLTVVDDPTARRHGDLPLAGSYRVDDEGIPARRLTLVSGGTLRALLGSRVPSRALSASNGHGRYLDRALQVRALPSNLLFLPRRPLTRAGLRRRLVALLQRRKLPHGFIVRRLRHDPPRPVYRAPTRTWWLPEPQLVHRVDAQGRETPVRGVALLGLPRLGESLAGMVAMGGPPRVTHWLLGSGNWISVMGHAFVVDGVRLEPASAPRRRPPLLPSPLGAP